MPSLLLAFSGSLTQLGVALLFAMLANVYVGPASLVLLIVALAIRSGALKWPLRVVAVINLILATPCLLVVQPIFIAQIALWSGVLVVLAKPPLAERFFGVPPPPPRP